MEELKKLVVVAENLKNNEIMSNCLKSNQGESSFSKINLGEYICKININTPIQMQQQLEELWGDGDDLRELIKIVTVASFKSRDIKNMCVDKIKERIYNF